MSISLLDTSGMPSSSDSNRITMVSSTTVLPSRDLSRLRPSFGGPSRGFRIGASCSRNTTPSLRLMTCFGIMPWRSYGDHSKYDSRVAAIENTPSNETTVDRDKQRHNDWNIVPVVFIRIENSALHDSNYTPSHPLARDRRWGRRGVERLYTELIALVVCSRLFSHVDLPRPQVAIRVPRTPHEFLQDRGHLKSKTFNIPIVA